MILDVRTMGLIAALLPLILGSIMIVYWRDRKTYGGFGRWILADFAFGAGYLLISLRGMIPDLFSIILGNVIAIYAEVLIYEGIQRFYNRSIFSRLNYLILTGYVLLQCYFTYFIDNINVRTALVSLVFAILIIRSGLSLLNCPFPSLRRTAQSAGLIFLITAVLPAVRMIYALIQTQPINLFSDKLGAWFSLVGVASILMWTFYFFLLNSARLELDLETARAELEAIASTDHLTGLYNRRHFFEHAEIEFQRAKRRECGLSFLLLDADEFKSVNDTYGHDAGDAVMITLAAIFQRQVRAFDLVARFGGDEFVIMLMDANEEQAYAIAERIRGTVEATPVKIGSFLLNINLSLGISSFNLKDPDLSVILKRADNALYHAKQRGRNRVEVA